MTRGRGLSRQVQAVAVAALILGSAVGAAWVPVGAARAESDTGGESVVSAATPPEPDRFEPNEGPTNPATLQPGNYTGLTFHNESDMDWYEVPVDRGDNISVTTRGQASLVQLYVPETVGNADSLGPTTGTAWATVAETDFENESYQDGTVFFYVVGDTGEYSLQISVDEPPEPDRFEPNDEYTNAAVLTPGNHTGLTRHGPEEYDWYKIPVDVGDNVTIRGGSPTGPPSMLGYFPQEGGAESFLATGGDVASATITGTNYENETFDDGYVYLFATSAIGKYWLDVTVDEPPEPDPYEPNDEYTNAAVLRAGNHTDLNEHSFDDHEWYKIPVDTGDTVTIRGGSATGSVSMLGYFPQDDGVESFLATGGETASATITGTNYENETYDDGYVYFTTATDIGGYWLDVTIDEPPEPDPYEPNDKITTAAVLQAGNHTDLNQHTPGDDDWYKIPVDIGENITIGVDSPNGTAWMFGYVPQADETDSFLRTNPGTSSATITGTNYENETYDDGYVYVMAGTGVGEYWLNVTVDEPPEPDRFEPNDDLTSAARLEPGNYTGLTHGEGDSDWYKVPVDRGDNVTIHAGGNSGASLFAYYPQADGAGTLLSTVGGPVSATVTGTNYENETWDDGYVYVAAGSDGEYWLNVTVTDPGPEPDRFEPNEDFLDAPSLSPGNYTGLTITDSSDVDWYRVPVDRGENVSIDVRNGSTRSFSLYYPTDDGIASEIRPADRPFSVTVSETEYRNETYEDGVAYLSVVGDPGRYWLNVTVTDAGLGPDRFESNDVIPAATELSPGRYSGLTLPESDAGDWYRVPVERGERLAVTVTGDGTSPRAFLYYRNASGAQVATGTGGERLAGTVLRTDWGDRQFADGFAYVQVAGEGRYALNVSVSAGENRAPTAVDARASPESGLAVEHYVFTRPGEPVQFTLAARDPDGDLDGAVWARNESTRLRRSLDGARETAEWSWTFDEPGVYSVVAQAVDEDDATSEPQTWTVVVGSKSYGELSAEVARINGREAGQHGYRLSRPIDNVTLRITRADGEPVPTESLGVAIEGASHVFPIEHVRGDLYRSDLRVDGVQGVGPWALIVDSQRLEFTLATVTESELRADPLRINRTTATALVTTDEDPLNAPIPGWVYDMDPDDGWRDVYVDGQRYLAVEMVRDRSDPYVDGVRQNAWLVFDPDGRLVENPRLRRKAALTAEVSAMTDGFDNEDVRTYREQIPGIVDRYIRQADGLESVATVRDSLAELAGTITAASATGGSSILAKQSARSASKALAKRFARKLFTDYISSEVAPEDPLAATEQGLELMSEAGLRRSAREAREVGRILDRRTGADWNYSDARRYWESYPNATTDLLFYMQVRSGTVPSGAPAAQFESLVESYATGATGVPVGQIRTLLSGDAFGYLSDAHENRTRSRALRDIDARSFRRDSEAIQQTALDRYDDRVLLGPRPSGSEDGAPQDQASDGDTGAATPTPATDTATPGGETRTATATPGGENGDATATPAPKRSRATQGTDSATADAEMPPGPTDSPGDAGGDGESGPGFGASVAVLALLAAALLARRRE